MAIQRGPYGTGFVKRLGNTVGYKMGGGKYGIVAYQPEVINPQTLNQRIQRAKFTFLRKVSANLRGEALRGLENQPYTGWPQAFMSMNMDSVTYQVSDNQITIDERISCEKMILSQGYETMPRYNLNQCVGGDFSTVLQTPKVEGANRPDGVIVVICVDKGVGMAGYEAQVFDWGYVTDSQSYYSTGTKHVSIIHPTQDPATYAYSIFVWAYNYRYVNSGFSRPALAFESEFGGTNGVLTMSSVAGVRRQRRAYSSTLAYGAVNIPRQ